MSELKTATELVVRAVLATHVEEVRAAFQTIPMSQLSTFMHDKFDMHQGKDMRFVPCPKCSALAGKATMLVEWKPTCALVASIDLVLCSVCEWFGEAGDE